jgi:hypothetical protein
MKIELSRMRTPFLGVSSSYGRMRIHDTGVLTVSSSRKRVTNQSLAPFAKGTVLMVSSFSPLMRTLRPPPRGAEGVLMASTAVQPCFRVIRVEPKTAPHLCVRVMENVEVGRRPAEGGNPHLYQITRDLAPAGPPCHDAGVLYDTRARGAGHLLRASAVPGAPGLGSPARPVDPENCRFGPREVTRRVTRPSVTVLSK